MVILVKNPPLISIIIHNYKGVHKLKRCLLSVLKSNYPNLEVIVVDALTDGIERWIKSNFQHVKILHFDQDYGIPARRNAGLKIISPNSKYIVFMDEDIIVSKNWLFPLIEVLESDPRIGVAQPIMLSVYKRDEIDNAGCYIDFIGYPHKADTSKYRKQFNSIVNVSYAETANMIVRREVLNKLPNPYEPFDIDYFAHWFDIDFSWRIQLAGYKVVLVPNSIVYHERRLTSGRWKLTGRNIFLNTRNRLMTLIKNYSFWSLIQYLPLQMIFTTMEIIALLRKRPDHAIATLHGIFWVLRNIKNIWRKRMIVQKFVRKVSDSYILMHFVHVNPLLLYREFQKHYNVVS
jgi:GT2 family glycosyltransferase